MATTSATLIAQRYAIALYNFLFARGEVDTIHTALNTLVPALQQTPQWQQLLQLPSHKLESIVQRLWQRLALPEALQRFLQVLLRRRRLALLPQMAEALTQVILRERKQGHAYVTAAVPLNTAQKQRLIDMLHVDTGRTMTLHETIDPTLLAGFTVQYMNRTIDVSLKEQLRLHYLVTRGNI